MLSVTPATRGSIYRNDNKARTLAIRRANLPLANVTSDECRSLFRGKRGSEFSMHFYDYLTNTNVFGQQGADFSQARPICIGDILPSHASSIELRKSLTHEPVDATGIHDR